MAMRIGQRIGIAIFAVNLSAGVMMLCGCNGHMYPYRVAGKSMVPLLGENDLVLVDESENARSELHDGDVIVFRHKDAVVVKRIIAMQGETVNGDQRKVFRDGKQIDEPYLAPVEAGQFGILTTFPPHKLAAGELFVLGDNRDLSADSRLDEYGPVHTSDVLGKYKWTYWHAKASAK